MIRLSNQQITEMEENAYRIRELAVRMICVGHWGHLGGSLSLAEVLSVLYGSFVNIDPANPRDPSRDYVILSKAHCSPALYAALAVKGMIPTESLDSYCAIDGLDGHLHQETTPGVESCGGSLGIGLSYAVGLALAMKKQERFAQRAYCIIGDGELSEGEIWEAAMSAAQYRLDNLIAVLDYNKVMAKGFIYNEMSQEPIVERFRAFGWSIIEADGHDVDDLYQAFHKAKYICVVGKPVLIVAHTVKGKGITECEFNYRWHTHAPDKKTANGFLEELARKTGHEFMPIEQPIRAVYSLQDVVEGGVRS